MSAAHLLARTKSGDNVSVLADQDGHLLARPALNLHHTVGTLAATTAMEPWVISPDGGADHGYVQITVLKVGVASSGESLAVDMRHPLAGGGWSDWLPLPLLTAPSHPTAGVLQLCGLPAGAEWRINYTNGSTAQTGLQFLAFAFGG